MTNWLRKVRNFVSKIPRGKVTAYGEIAKALISFTPNRCFAGVLGLHQFNPGLFSKTPLF
jgi:alkylated DNA nucleotide flippase Atl1